MELKEVLEERLVTLSCHSEQSEETELFDIVQDSKINNLAEPKFDNPKEQCYPYPT
jgi:hypothetical protein